MVPIVLEPTLNLCVELGRNVSEYRAHALPYSSSDVLETLFNLSQSPT
jgi:hypothetical protein